MIATGKLGSQTDLASSKSSTSSLRGSKGTRSSKSPLSSEFPKRPPPLEPSTSHFHGWLGNLRRPKTSPHAKPSPLAARSILSEDERRDSALLPASPAPTSSTTATILPDAALQGLNRVSSLPTIVVHGSQSKDIETTLPRVPVPTLNQDTATASPLRPHSTDDAAPDFCGITTLIPTGGFDDFSSPEKLQFSKRGSMLLDGRRAAMFASSASSSPPATPKTPKPPQTPNHMRSRDSLRISPSLRSGNVLSIVERDESQRLRSRYEYGREDGAEGSALTSQTLVEEEGDCETQADEALKTATTFDFKNISTSNLGAPRSPSFNNRRESFIEREPYELAGGIEDWTDVHGGEVDRYGFLMPKPKKAESSAFETSGLPRTSTALAEASESPRRKRTMRRASSKTRRSQGVPQRKPSQKSHQPNGSIRSFRSTGSFNVYQSPLRYASNRLPQNKERRWMDEASDMLTLAPGLADMEASTDDSKTKLAIRKKEWQREEKWRKMGKVSHRSTKGGGMQFDFDPRDPKVISRTWKGIPDKWRASAWYSFLAASAKQNRACQTEEELVEIFHELQEENSADDGQIDCDVPRTINKHIMFRTRYRGGQRLLFRVLHAMSLYFPDTRYVQGMGPLAATLLCYYDEEQAFVMMVRLWQLRGLERIYESGFPGLAEALQEFEDHWLDTDVRKKLVSFKEMDLTSSTYGTRWYLTLFNYSIPFPAQLRVWDCFMLLGDLKNASDPKNSFGADLAVLHATSAALIDATREILLDSDFENAMRVLTSWIPVKDEELLMKVAYAEWKQRKK
ncbi:RabGAP/TBC [Tothia fuscella]|uniref:RabGAP/TBC n=1 Tax=Tothia fuscella TaxID=1048955 RepID=A0A9P4TVW3_9PEZI|nr:RabGAP/TBC [Tothia fuscella]